MDQYQGGDAFIPINLLGVTAVSTTPEFPTGHYLLQPVDVQVKTNTDGQTQRVAISSAIVMGPGTSTEFCKLHIFHSYQLTEKGVGFLKRLLIACGVTEEQLAQTGGMPRKDWLIGRQFVANVAKNSAGYYDVKNERPASEWNRLVSKPGQSAQGVPMNPQGQGAIVQPMTNPPMQQSPYVAPPVAPPMQQYQQPVPQQQYQQPMGQQMPQQQFQQMPQQMPQQMAQPVMPQATGIPVPVPPPGRVA